MLEAPGRFLTSRPLPPPPTPPRPPPRAHNHYVKTSAKMSSNYREGDRDLQSELERERRRFGGALSPEPHLEVMRPVSPFQTRRHNPIYQQQQQQQRQPSPSPYSYNTPFHSQTQLHANAQTNAYAGSSRVQERRHEVWTPPPTNSAEDGRSNQSHSTRETHQSRTTEQSRPTSPETTRKRDWTRRKPAPKYESTPPQTPSTSEAPHLPAPYSTRPPMPATLPQQLQQQQPTSNPPPAKSHSTPVILTTTAPPRPTRAATDQVPSLFRDLTRQSEVDTGKAKVIPTAPPNVLSLHQQQQQQQSAQAAAASSWNPALAFVSTFKAPAPERADRNERQERQERQERADRQDRFERPERVDRQERLDRQERQEQERAERQERLEKQERERQERLERQEQQERDMQERLERQERERLERIEQQERAEQLERIERQKQIEHQERVERQERELAERQERIERQERLRQQRLEEQERIRRQERLEEQERQERQEKLEQQERIARRQRAELQERLAQQERQTKADLHEKAERPERLDRGRTARQERPAEEQENPRFDRQERLERPPVPMRQQRQDSLQVQPTPRSHQPSPVPQTTLPVEAQPAPQVQPRTQVAPTAPVPVLAPRAAPPPRAAPQEYAPQRREPQPPASVTNIQPPPAAYTANHVTHTGAVDSVPAFPPPAEVRHEAARSELQRPPIVQPQPKKVSSFSQLAAMIRPSRSPSPMVTPPQPTTATTPKNVAGLRAQEQEQPSLSFSRSVASSWKNSRSPSPLVHSAESAPSSPPKSNLIFHAHQVALPASKGSSTKSSRAPSPRAPSPHVALQDIAVPYGQDIQLQFFRNISNRAPPSPSPLARPQELPAEVPLPLYSSRATTQAGVPTLVDDSRSTEKIVPTPNSWSANASEYPHSELISQPLDVFPETPERPRSPPRPTIPQYPPPPPPFPPAPPSTPVLALKARNGAVTRSQLVPAIQAKCIPTEDVIPQITPGSVPVAIAAPTPAPPAAPTPFSTRTTVLPASVKSVEERTVFEPKEEERKSTPPIQMGLVTPPETPPTSFQERPAERKVKRKSVTPAPQDNVIRGALSSSKVRSPSPVDEISGPATMPARIPVSRIPVSIPRPVREPELPMQSHLREEMATEAFSTPRPITPAPDAEPNVTFDAPSKPAVQPPLPPDWRDVIHRVVAPSELAYAVNPTEYDEDSSMLPPIKTSEKPFLSSTRFDSGEWPEREKPAANRMVLELHVREVHVNPEPPVIPESVLPKEEDLVWHTVKSSRPLPVAPSVPHPQPESEQTQPAWFHSSRTDKSSFPPVPSASMPRSYSPVPGEELPHLQDAQKATMVVTEWQIDRADEATRSMQEQVAGPSTDAAQTGSRERPSGSRRRERSIHHHKREPKEAEQIKVEGDNGADMRQNAMPSTPFTEAAEKPVLPSSLQQVSLTAAANRPLSPELSSGRPISPPPRNQSLENRRGLNNETVLTKTSDLNMFDRQGQSETRPSSPPVVTRATSPLPSPPQVVTQTKPPRPPKPQAHGHNKRPAPHEEFRPPTPPHNHYKKRSYDVLPTEPGNFLKPATHILYPDTSSDCHSLMPFANASRPQLASQSQLRYESSRDTAGLQSKSARELHSRQHNARERNRRHPPFSPTSDTQDELRSEVDEDSDLENDLPSPPGSDSSHGEHRVRHINNDPYTDVTIERATRGYRSKPVGRARAHTLTLPPSPTTAKDRRGRRRRSRSPTSSSGRSRSGHRPRATKPGRSQSEKVTRDRGVSPLGRSRSSPLPSSRNHQQRGFWRSFGSWAMLFFSKFRRWGSASAPNSPATVPRRRRDYNSDY